ncbi:MULTISPECIES: cation diffusion facilitator family transporter [unclassified Bradyrhizobium]|uniref:cation diffusion facilitator family transporter n=1 Tax=unclassified Bradyrhizobium TaxID=2631580 RepID=UPI00247A8C85|nr:MULTISPECIES: cation diffusion facilitator family transporter [unclassified Bradyrhizobium]WGR72679.1 cation diffusion facilitator family transporter [Bradyrhizobium sp. ISRA426]WGR77512.1 cation diffusion facilitator family transporter [Bradyrhizobium sp. ISRA430]WGR87918.1 cation diffusion facilitator family transporter [Bradyrhizobium sp. ISRA432]
MRSEISVRAAAQGSSKTIVRAALIGNMLVAATKTAAAFWTGSSAMMSEAVHSVVDTSNEVLLLYGYHRASRPPDESHPLGYGRELYFWSFIVALLIFALGSGVSLYQGLLHVAAPEPIEDPIVSFVVLGLSFLFEGASWLFALRRFRSESERFGYYQAFVRSKDPPAFMVLLEDSAALVGIAIAAGATAAAVWLAQPVWDGVGSILIGILLGIASIGLARESKSLLIGEPAHPELARSILAIARRSPGVLQANGLLTAQLSPSEVVAALSVEYADDKRADDIEQCVISIETEIRKQHPSVAALFIKPQTDARYRTVRGRRLGLWS